MFQTEATDTSDRNQRPLWWNVTCDHPFHDHDGEGLDGRRQCTWEQDVDKAQGLWVEHRAFNGQLVGEHDASLPCPLCPPVQGPAPDELVPEAECVEPSCGRGCEYDPRWGTFSHEVSMSNADVYVYCQCEHHTDPAFQAAAVRWLREGRA